jgi:TolB-like protein/Tfp pilus assembly protein PilF/predicted Ser/Thr protein kinase
MSGDADLWGRVKSVFLDALDLPDDERAAFVASACADDPRIRLEVESLLTSDRAAASFGETPAASLLGGGDAIDLVPPRLAPGTRLGAYEIESFIAAGGMGEVYRARHTVLGREVAIKIVGAHKADDGAQRRLLREARHAAILTHPNICTVYEVGESEWGPFIVMRYVRGRPLGALVRQCLPELKESLSYAIQIAEALEYAHRQGIVHRDLKTSNVVVTAEHQAVVLDFGLAKRLPTDATQSRDPTITARDALAGTLSYMAPEVLLGRTADVRSDVWALGVVLYELVTGNLPFRGQTHYETSSAILGDSPRPIGRRVPLALRLVIERCLLKDPDRRYQRVADVGAALEAIRRRRAWPLVGRLLVSTRGRTVYMVAGCAVGLAGMVYVGPRLYRRFAGSAHHRVSTLALLPLENATGSADATYYAEGITDDIIAQIGTVGDVRIISRVSAARVTREMTTVREIGEKLGADALVQGALRRASDRIAVDLRLVQPASGAVLWSDRFERPATDVLALEADVVRALALAIRLNIRPDAQERLATIRAVSPPVYEEYLKGRYEWNSRTPRSLERAVDHFARAIQLDPTYAPAHAALADCYNQLGTVMVGTGSPTEFRPRAESEAIKALQLDPGSAEAHAALGYVRHYDWQWAEAEKEFRRAIELNPSYALARIWYANLLMSRLRMPEALRQVMLARDLDPFSLIVNTNVGWVLNNAGRHAEAAQQLARTLELDSQYVQARWRLADALTHIKRYDQAIVESQRVVGESHRALPGVGLLAIAYARAGADSSARSLLREMLDRSRAEYLPPWSVADVLLSLGLRDSALHWLEKAFDERSNAMAYLLVEPDFAPLHDDPRYRAMVVRAGLR